jgi:polysaccharide pyruvyl transferase WcaK-like protein
MNDKESSARAKKKCIFLYGYFGAGNIGDELILTAFLTMLDSRGVKRKLIVAVERPEYYDRAAYEKDYKNLDIVFLKRYKNPFNFNNISAFSRSAAFVIPGGGIFQDYSSLSFLCYYSFLACSKLFGVKNYLLFQGLTGIKREFFVKMMVFAANNLSDYLSVRDEASAEFLSKRGAAAADPCGDYSDPVFALNSSIGEKVRSINAGAGKEGVIGVSLRPWKGAGARDIARALSDVVEKTGLDMKLYSMQEKIDCDFNSLVIGSLDEKTRSRITKTEYINDSGSLVRSLSLNSLNIGMRFHFSVLSMIAGVPCIGLSYDEKVGGLYKRANLQQLCVSGPEFAEFASGRSEPLIKRADYALKNAGRLKDAVGRFAAGREKVAKLMFDDFYMKCLL